MSKEMCYLCEEAVQEKLIEENEVQVATQECFICTKPVCDFHSSSDARNKNMRICDDCQVN